MNYYVILIENNMLGKMYERMDYGEAVTQAYALVYSKGIKYKNLLEDIELDGYYLSDDKTWSVCIGITEED